MLTTCDQVTLDFNSRCKQCLIVSWPFLFHNADSVWLELGDCSDVLIVMEPLNSEVKQERVSLGRDVERVEKTNSKETWLFKRWQSEAHSFDFSMGNSCAGHIRKHVCQILPSTHWNACGSPRSIPNACFGSTWERVHDLRVEFLLPEVCCQPLSILFSPQGHMEDRNNLFKNVPHPLSMLWLKWMRHVFAEKVWCQILSRVLCVVEGSLSSWSLSWRCSSWGLVSKLAAYHRLAFSCSERLNLQRNLFLPCMPFDISFTCAFINLCWCLISVVIPCLSDGCFSIAPVDNRCGKSEFHSSFTLALLQNIVSCLLG